MENKFESKDNELELSTELGQELSDSELANVAGGNARQTISRADDTNPLYQGNNQTNPLYQGKA